MQKIILNTKDASAAVETLFGQALKSVSVLMNEEAVRRSGPFTFAWKSRLLSGSSAEMHELVLANLRRLALRKGFCEFNVIFDKVENSFGVNTTIDDGGFFIIPLLMWRSPTIYFLTIHGMS